MTPDDARQTLVPLYDQVARVLVGQRYLIDRLLVGLLTGGHILLEGAPGLAKTLAVRTLARTLHLTFKRIQFTPDLLPADVIGTQIYNPRSGEFTVKRGPIFANLLLADEINRSPAKVQSALLEAMQERQVTLGNETFALDEPFLVLATQNPIEQEGTYPLPEAQLDRFMMKLKIGYPSREDELLILDRMAGIEPLPEVEAVLGPQHLPGLRRAMDAVHVDGRIKGYVVDLVRATREDRDGLIQYGAGPRGPIFLLRAAKGQAFLAGRAYVAPQDVKDVFLDVMRHRIAVSYEAEAEDLTSDAVLSKILGTVAVP